MKAYKVSETLRPYVRRNLKRHLYSCRMVQDTSGSWRCLTNAPSDSFHKIVGLARAEKESKETGIACVPKTMVNRANLVEGKSSYTVSHLLENYL